MKYLLDSNVCIDYLNRRHPSVVERIQESSPEDLCLSSIGVAELRCGADRSLHREKNHGRLDVLVAEIRCLDFDLSAAEAYEQIRSRLEAEGTPIGPNDLLIAAQALAAGLTLVSDNEREFRRVPGLRVESWRTEPQTSRT